MTDSQRVSAEWRLLRETERIGFAAARLTRALPNTAPRCRGRHRRRDGGTSCVDGEMHCALDRHSERHSSLGRGGCPSGMMNRLVWTCVEEERSHVGYVSRCNHRRAFLCLSVCLSWSTPPTTTAKSGGLSGCIGHSSFSLCCGGIVCPRRSSPPSTSSSLTPPTLLPSSTRLPEEEEEKDGGRIREALREGLVFQGCLSPGRRRGTRRRRRSEEG